MEKLPNLWQSLRRERRDECAAAVKVAVAFAGDVRERDATLREHAVVCA